MRIHTQPAHGGRPVPSMVFTCRHELSSVDVAQVLIRAAREGRTGRTVGVDLTRPAAETLLSAALYDLGARAGAGWDTDWGFEDAGHAVRWASEQIRRLWPALSDRALAELVAGYAPPLLHTLTPASTATPGSPDRPGSSDAGRE